MPVTPTRTPGLRHTDNYQYSQPLLKRQKTGQTDSEYMARNAEWFDNDDNIGLYMKCGFCYSDVKSFVPMVIAMALVAIWFSEKRSKHKDKAIKQKRIQIIKAMDELPERMKKTLTPEYIELYKAIGNKLKRPTHNLICLGKGTGFFAARYIADKFLQIAGIQAEGYPSGEFRHGPMAMIDREEATPVIIVALDDEHLSLTVRNIIELKCKGASVIVISTVKDIASMCDGKELDFLVQLEPSTDVLAAIQAIPPLHMIVYYTALARGINPDQQVFDSIDFASSKE